MRAVCVTFDEDLLREFDQSPEVRGRGRSAVLSELVGTYLARKRSEEIAREYREGYTTHPQTDKEIEDWAGIQAWLDDKDA